MRLAIVIAILLAHHATAHACKKRGKVIFREVQAPLPGHEDAVPDATFEILDTGAWFRVQEMPDGQEPSSQSGCVAKKHFKLLKAALAKAKFQPQEAIMCEAVSERTLTYAAPRRKKKVSISDPCGETLDATTSRLVQCADSVDYGLTPAEVRGVCGAK